MQVYLVGGAVRDMLLQRPVKDRDYVVVGATVEDMLAQGFTPVGKDFPVFLHPKTQAEYALARTERKIGTGYGGFSFSADPNVTLEQDLQRRDLTINAMAKGDDEQLVDPYDGQTDLEARIFRHVSPAFVEDPLRVLRVARFLARYHEYGFTIAPETTDLLKQMCATGELKALAAPRVLQETLTAMAENSPWVYWQTLHEIGGLDDWFNEIKAVINDPVKATEIKHILTNIDKEGSTDHPPQPEQAALAIWAYYLNDSELTTWLARLPFSNIDKDILTLVQQNHSVFAKIYRSGQAYLDSAARECEGLDEYVEIVLRVFEKMDVARRPERLERCLAIHAWYCAGLEPEFPVTQFFELFTLLLAAVKGVDVQSIIAHGYQGAAIKPQLRAEQLLALKHIFCV
jgi:tRNA nucleotidyltransferase (CCA-adding enzyme)